ARGPARLVLVGDRRGDVDAVRVVQPDPRVRDRDHGRALLREELREEAADIAEPLHGYLQVLQPELLLPGRLLDAVERAARGCLEPAEGAADVQRLAGDDARAGGAL